MKQIKVTSIYFMAIPDPTIRALDEPARATVPVVRGRFEATARQDNPIELAIGETVELFISPSVKYLGLVQGLTIGDKYTDVVLQVLN